MTVRSARSGGFAGAAAVLLAALSSACSPGAAVTQQALAPSCYALGGTQQELLVNVSAPVAGLMRVTLDLRGIAAIARLGARGGSSNWSASPIERFGTITLAREVDRGDSTPVAIASTDSREMSGEVCAAAEVIVPLQSPPATAARWLAAAGDASYRSDWQAAFEGYLAASRILDGLHQPDGADKARHAMAQLDYNRLQRKRDAVALAELTLRRATDPALRGARLTLMASALMEMPQETRPPRPTTGALLAAAAAAFRATPAGRRELPRLTTLAGFEQYSAVHVEEARRLFESAAVDCRALRDWQCFARARQNLAVVAEEQQDYASALASFEDALRVLDTSRMTKLAGTISENIGKLENLAGQFGRSEEAHKAAILLFSRIADCDGARDSAASLGEMLASVGSLDEAESLLDQSVTLECPELLAALGQSVAEREPRQATDPGVRGEAVPGTTPHPACSGVLPVGSLTSEGAAAVFNALMARGSIALLESDLRSDSRCLSAARGYANDPWLRVWHSNALGELDIAEGRFEPARTEYARALQIADQAGIPSLSDFRGAAEIGLANATLSAGDTAAARAHALRAISLSAERADLGQLVSALRPLAGAFRASNDHASALRTLRLAVRLMEQVPTEGLEADRRASYLATQHDVFAELTDLMISDAEAAAAPLDTHALWDAFATSEEGRARALRYALTQMNGSRSTPSAEVRSSEYRALLRQIAEATRQPRAAGGDPASGLWRLEALLGPSAAPSAAVTDGRELARALGGSGSTLIEYAVGDTDMFAFVVDPRQIHVVRLARIATIARAAARLLEGLRDAEPDGAQIRAAASELAHLVWWPLVDYVTQRRVVVVPDDSLNNVPFAVLPWSETDSGVLLLQRAEMTSLPSAALLLVTPGGRSAGSDRFVLLGDPVFRSTTWRRDCADGAMLSVELQDAFDSERRLPSLPGTAAEVQAVADIARAVRPGVHVETLLHCSATVASLRSASANAQLLHVATHGLVDARRPRLSSLALTPDARHPTESAYRLLEILNQPLHSRLVVLSACDTSRGRLLAGEGVMGLAQAFLQAGARSVVASYWRVPDGSTVPFMDRFYGYLLRQHLPVATALRRAQLDTLDQGNPYSWAAFGLYGRADSEI